VQRYFSRGGKDNTKFTYDGQDVVQDNNDGVITKYQNGLGIDNKLKQTTNGTSRYFLQDHLGSTTGLTNSSGSLVESASYDAFGNASGNLSTRYSYTGREYDSFTGLYYYRARFYDAKLGRFISEDPIGFKGKNVNLFGYVRNNPINKNDPLGLYENPYYGTCIAAFAGVGAGAGFLAGGGAGIFTGPGAVAAVPAGAYIGLGAGGAIGTGAGILACGSPPYPTTSCDTKPKPFPRISDNDRPREDEPNKKSVCTFIENDGIVCHYICRHPSGISFPLGLIAEQYGNKCPNIIIR
jgi:RHS repeat-associated protein